MLLYEVMMLSSAARQPDSLTPLPRYGHDTERLRGGCYSIALGAGSRCRLFASRSSLLFVVTAIAKARWTCRRVSLPMTHIRRSVIAVEPTKRAQFGSTGVGVTMLGRLQ